MDPNLAITQVRTMEESLALNTSLQREMMMVVTGFAVITLGMATLGLAGVMAYAVSRRRREIGLRMALGASTTDVRRAVLRRASRLVGGGYRGAISRVRWPVRGCSSRCCTACSRRTRS